MSHSVSLYNAYLLSAQVTELGTFTLKLISLKTYQSTKYSTQSKTHQLTSYIYIAMNASIGILPVANIFMEDESNGS